LLRLFLHRLLEALYSNIKMSVSALKNFSFGIKQASTTMASTSMVGVSLRRFADAAAEKNIFIGNLAWEVTEAEISEHFGKYGTVTSIKLMKDNQTGRPRGFGFLTVSGQPDKAIAELDGKDFKGRSLRVNEAKAPTPRDPNSRPPRSNIGGGDRFNGERQDRFNGSQGDRFGERQDRFNGTGGVGGDRYQNRGAPRRRDDQDDS